jgi:hypothetical protein
MHLLNILNFKSFSLPQLEEYILQHDTGRYEITIPKKEFEDDTEFTRWQYYMAAYAGHRLSLASTSFGYNVPCPHTVVPFRFEIEYIDDKKFAYALYCIIKGFYSDRHTTHSFQDEALKHFLNCFTDKAESTCWGLLHIANKKTFS